MAVSDYSTTAASNTSISGIDISGTTGKVKDGDNAIRQLMADIKAGVPYLSGTSYLIESTDAGATAGPIFDLYRNSASPAASDILGQIVFNGKDSAGNKQEYGSIESVIIDPTSTSEDSALDIYLFLAGTRTKAFGLQVGQLKFPATQNASSDANTLDDYEEATFTPGMTFGGSATGVTTSTATGLNTTIGNAVSYGITLTLTSNGSGTGTAVVTGLSYTAATVTPGAAFCPFSGFSGLTAGVCGVATSTTVTMRAPNTTGSGALTDINVTDTASFSIGGGYFKA